ncbi:hypothetical protein LIER_37607 [Lithospermum erythrorhizon]|uniref:Uncharacterized protein n=1 Tax=Lithospermum erythrorhizon TaxID=34254 RepID=A0AAV3PNY7_LITER
MDSDFLVPGFADEVLVTWIVLRWNPYRGNSPPGSCTMPHKVNYKGVTMGKDPLAMVSKRKGVATLEDTSDASALTPVPKKSRRTARKVIPKDAPVVIEVLPKTTNPPSPELLPVITFNIPDHIPSLDIVASVQESPPLVPHPVASSSSGGTSLGYLYFLPSGITVTEKTVSKREEPTVC